jgi:uncharacterized protein YqjF (DUF2071 family)
VPRPFLTAKWLNVAAVTFAVEPERLRPYLPAGAEIDELEGAARVSLVAFEFRDTRVLGAKVPRHVDFPEINLRFYIRYGGERGVVFIRELVPRTAIASVARLVYNEPYRRVPMSCGAVPLADTGGVRVWHRFAGGSSLRVDGAAAATVPEEGTAAHWLTDHSLGLGRRRDGRTLVYHVAHPTWALREVTDVYVDVDFASVYGPQWAWLATAEPSHLSLAVGSEVSVFLPTKA